jgi:hypothetical protein
MVPRLQTQPARARRGVAQYSQLHTWRPGAAEGDIAHLTDDVVHAHLSV